MSTLRTAHRFWKWMFIIGVYILAGMIALLVVAVHRRETGHTAVLGVMVGMISMGVARDFGRWMLARATEES